MNLFSQVYPGPRWILGKCEFLNLGYQNGYNSRMVHEAYQYITKAQKKIEVQEMEEVD